MFCGRVRVIYQSESPPFKKSYNKGNLTVILELCLDLYSPKQITTCPGARSLEGASVYCWSSPKNCKSPLSCIQHDEYNNDRPIKVFHRQSVSDRGWWRVVLWICSLSRFWLFSTNECFFYLLVSSLLTPAQTFMVFFMLDKKNLNNVYIKY